VPFEGICLTDTFALYEKDDLVSEVLADNSTRRRKQKQLDIRVIVGNPPYSAGQKSENDNNGNISYPTLDESIRNTYAKFSSANLQKSLYDSYVRAIRWASNRIGSAGVISFVSNASFVDGNSMDGLRKCLTDEFSSIYIFHLRGNQRTSGELSRKEGGKIFGAGSRSPIAISVLVKNPNASTFGKIQFFDIGDYLTREQKLEKIVEFGSVQGITNANLWKLITPDSHNDWIGQRDDSFNKFIKMGDKDEAAGAGIFCNYSLGVATNRDAWCYNYSKVGMLDKMGGMIDFYNAELQRYEASASKNNAIEVENFLNNDPTKISWTDSLKNNFSKKIRHKLIQSNAVVATYRPFTKAWLYFDKFFNQRRYQMPQIFPNDVVKNRLICVTGRGATKDFCAFLVDKLPDLEMVSKGQCFPLKLFEAQTSINSDTDLFSEQEYSADGYIIKDGISDEGLRHFTDAYNGASITKEDLFYYIYGLLHSEEYKARYADNLSKELPRIPAVKKFDDFMAFSSAGRKLADLHLNYETVEPYAVSFEGGALLLNTLTDSDYYVTQMKFASKADKSTVIYNHKITIHDIPVEAYEYVVNGKPALEWVMERQAVTTHKDSGIVNDANLWARETMGDAAYPLKLFQRVITVSLETMKIVKALPKLDID